MEIRLQKIIELKGRLVLESNLHIGSGNMDMHIGGTDNPIIKHPHTLEPFIPGSSIKGKVRSLMELSSGVAQEAFKQNPNSGGLASLALFKKAANDQKKEVSDILKIFGFSGSDKSDEDGLAASLGPTRVSFADCYLNKEWKEKAIENLWPLAIEKSETAIDRISGTAKRGTLRQTEMVPAGAVFDFRLSFKILCDDDKELFKKLKKGLELLEKDALGGSGSRGYGRIRFEDIHEE
ncbi:MAG TPA: type III-A CRISPR-associated RAMP protein Csm3 [Candidatus Rifleibacterium sp.]|nr:type III-A CRISPR-associated RAMP protein Csm3 [Candidatus Rifleibacterium sp.]HPT46762.1 type III-A CRISPR-associated RAMP protein Csm3 [Candidatus Rifleibacterium sp.]